MYKTKAFLLLFFLPILLMYSCGTDDSPQIFDYSDKIIGQWQQVRTFNRVDASKNPAVYNWFDVTNGFTLSLAKDGTFEYSRFGNCTTGTYFFDPKLAKIEFYFDCEIEYNGETITKLTESFGEDTAQNDVLLLFHAYGRTDCEAECNSYLKRIK